MSKLVQDETDFAIDSENSVEVKEMFELAVQDEERAESKNRFSRFFNSKVNSATARVRQLAQRFAASVGLIRIDEANIQQDLTARENSLTLNPYGQPVYE